MLQFYARKIMSCPLYRLTSYNCKIQCICNSSQMCSGLLVALWGDREAINLVPPCFVKTDNVLPLFLLIITFYIKALTFRIWFVHTSFELQ